MWCFNFILYTLGVFSAGVFMEYNKHMCTRAIAYVSDTHETIQNTPMYEVVVNIFWNVVYFYNWVKNRLGKLRETYPLVRSFSESLKTIFTPKSLVVPTGTSVIAFPYACVIRLIKTPDDKLRVIEDKFDLTDYEWKYKTHTDNMLSFKYMANQILLTDDTVQECLILYVLSKTETICRVIARDTNIHEHDNLDDIPHMSPVKYLAVVYEHPSMDDSVELEVDRSYFMERNQILSASFVGTILPKHILFDTQYKISVIDDEVRTMEWNCFDFVELTHEKTPIMRKRITFVQNGSQTENKSGDKHDTKSWDEEDVDNW